jgi:putative restriction endonuclease
MGFGVFIHRTDSIYDDSPAERYQFPAQYLGRIQKCVGDWIIYYEPRKIAATRGYFAVAKILQVIPDPNVPGMYLALIVPGSYLDFVNPVPFSGENGVIERGLLNEAGRISGRAQAAVRPISPDDFNRILSFGLGDYENELPRSDERRETILPNGFPDSADAPFPIEQDRERITQLSSRIVRDRLFRRLVLQAYDKRCAITGLKLIDDGGRAEVDAAHIRPVGENGPDILSNGIALSGTAHWMFDRGLICLSDELEILISRHANDRGSIQGLINKTGRAIVPTGVYERPHPHFVRWHRENMFKH